MPPPTWHNADQRAFFALHMPHFIARQAQAKLYKFWGPMYESWFQQYPEQGPLGFPLPSEQGDSPFLTPVQMEELGNAIILRKKKIENYFRNNCKKLPTIVAKHRKSELGLAFALFHAKPPRQRLHKAEEIFQMRNNSRIREECTRKGHDSITEEAMSQVVPDWVDESDEEQVSRVKAAAAARLRLRTRVVKALFAEASEEELQAIADVMEREKAGDMVDVTEGENGAYRTPAEYQASIDESWDVMKRVHRILMEMTGWYGFSMWGGPNPEIAGELSMKCVASGESLAGNDFISSVVDFDQVISGPFRDWVSRCFPPGVRLERASEAITGLTSGGGTTMVPVEPSVPAPEKTTVKPKRMTKPKKTAPSPPLAPSPPTPIVPPTAATSPTPAAAQLQLASAPSSPTNALDSQSSLSSSLICFDDDDVCMSMGTGFSEGEDFEELFDTMYGMPPLPLSYASRDSPMTEDWPTLTTPLSPSTSSQSLVGGQSSTSEGSAYPMTPPARLVPRPVSRPSFRPTTSEPPPPSHPTFSFTSAPNMLRPTFDPRHSSHSQLALGAGAVKNGAPTIARLFNDFHAHSNSSPTRDPTIQHLLTAPREPFLPRANHPPFSFPLFMPSTQTPPATSTPPRLLQHLPTFPSSAPLRTLSPALPPLPSLTPTPSTSLGLPDSTLALPPAPPRTFPRSRPMANPPKSKTAPKAKTVPKAKVAAKMAAKKKGKGRAVAAAGDDGNEDDTSDADTTPVAPLVDTSNIGTSGGAVPVPSYSITNNNRGSARRAHLEAEAAAAASPGRVRRKAEAAANPHEIIFEHVRPPVVVPAPRAPSGRARKAPAQHDGQIFKLKPKLTRAETRAAQNAGTENALLARSAATKAKGATKRKTTR
ncbi:hypothetical protein DFH09DRAFT_1351456 [Mycena vulgaris]|nr:hypothetical protein DFH09DRAFT_1351456 [Mycena vulgaris]